MIDMEYVKQFIIDEGHKNYICWAVRDDSSQIRVHIQNVINLFDKNGYKFCGYVEKLLVFKERK